MAALGVAIVVAAIWDVNVFRLPALDLIGIENNEEGEVCIAFPLIIPAIFIDRVTTRQRP